MKYILIVMTVVLSLVACGKREFDTNPKQRFDVNYVNYEFCYDGTMYIQMHGGGGMSVKFKDGKTVSCN